MELHNIDMIARGGVALNPFIIIVCVVQVAFFLLFLREVFRISAGFVQADEETVAGVCEHETKAAQDGSSSKSDDGLPAFVRPYIVGLVQSGSAVSWDDVTNQLLYKAVRHEEMARAWMNNIIVLGLFGTAATIAYPVVLSGEVLDNIIRVVPMAFIPGTVGLLLGIIASPILSRKFSEVHEKAEMLTFMFKRHFPHPISVADILRQSFTGELQKVFCELPGRITESFESVRLNLASVNDSITGPLRELASMMQHALKEMETGFDGAIKTSLEQFETFSVKLTAPIDNLEKQVEKLNSTIGNFGTHSQSLQESVVGFSGELTRLVNHTDKSHQLMESLVDKIEKAAIAHEQALKRSQDMISASEALYKHIHDEYSTYTTDIFMKFSDSVDEIKKGLDGVSAGMRDENANLCTTLKASFIDSNTSYLRSVENIFGSHLTELYKKVDERMRTLILEEMNHMRDVNQSFSLLASEYEAQRVSLSAYTDEFKRLEEELSAGANAFRSSVEETGGAFAKMSGWAENLKSHEISLKQFVGAADRMGTLLKESQRQRDRRLSEILARIEGIARQI